MKTQLSAIAAARPRCVALRSAAAFAAPAVEVDTDKAIIFGAAIISAGPAAGHGFQIDAKTLQQVAALINEKPNGVPVRFKHPDPPSPEGIPDDTLGRDVGYVRNARVEGDVVRGDVHLADYAEVLPGLGNAKEYLLRKAKSDPTGFGLSAVAYFQFEEQLDEVGNVACLVARASSIDAVDFVSRPAANANGLLAAKDDAAPAELKAMCEAVIAACKQTVADCRVGIDAGAALTGTADSVQAVIDSGEAIVASCQATIGAARLVIDAANLIIPSGPMDQATADAASACIRMCRLCIDTCRSVLNALDRVCWGTSDMAKSCERAARLCRTCMATCDQCWDACRPFTTSIAAMLAKKRLTGDASQNVQLTKK